MQQPNAGITRARSALRWCPCASCIWLLHPAPILVLKMILTLCYILALVVFFPPSTSANTSSLCTHGGYRALQLALVVFFLGALRQVKGARPSLVGAVNCAR